MTKPLVKARMVEHFDYRVQTDLYFVWDKTYIILIDECIRYCTATRINSKLSSEWLRALFVGWVKFFGPMTILASDQEGAITSDQLGIACEKFGIKLVATRRRLLLSAALLSLSFVLLSFVLQRKSQASQSRRTCVLRKPAWLLI